MSDKIPGYAYLYHSLMPLYSCERESAADGSQINSGGLGKSPHQSGSQPGAIPGGESHGNGTETTRPILSNEAAEPLGEKCYT